MSSPVGDTIFNKVAMSQQAVADQLTIRELLKHFQRLPRGPDAKPIPDLCHTAYPLARVYRITDSIDPAVRGAEICIGA